MNRRIFRDKIIKFFIVTSAVISVGMLFFIIGFIFSKGLSKVNLDFISREYNPTTQYVTINNENLKYEEPEKLNQNEVFIDNYGLILVEDKTEDKEIAYRVVYVDGKSSVVNAKNAADEVFGIKKGDMITKVGSEYAEKLSIKDMAVYFKESPELRLKVVRPGGGIWPLIVTTIELIELSLIVAIPVGVLSAVYLIEYAKPGKVVSFIRFATECLAGIPSIVYGLFGMIFFVKTLNIGESLLAGSLTLSILLLPTIIRTTEETLKTVPISYKEASFGLGASRLQTLWRVIMPSAIPGILVAVILSIGRIVGESAALLFTIGTFAKIPKNIRDSGTSLTVRAYVEVKEYGNVEMAAAIGVVLIMIVLILNLSARAVSRKLTKGNI